MSTALAERIDPEARSRFAVRTMGDTPVLEPRLPRPFRAFFTTRLGGESSRPVRVAEPRPALGGRVPPSWPATGSASRGTSARAAGEPDAGARAAGGGGAEYVGGARRRRRVTGSPSTPCSTASSPPSCCSPIASRSSCAERWTWRWLTGAGEASWGASCSRPERR